MKQIFWNELNEELQKAVSKKGHPFRFFTLATAGLDNLAILRTVVLRKVSKNLDLVIYTDKRSKKITHIKENNKVSLLFYNPEKMLQLKVEGKAEIITDKIMLNKHWNAIQINNRKDYITKNAPGSVINNPDAIEYIDSENHFCMLQIQPFKIEYLKLKRPNHIRIRFSKLGEKWHEEFLTP